jgi:hypothetical protein
MYYFSSNKLGKGSYVHVILIVIIIISIIIVIVVVIVIVIVVIIMSCHGYHLHYFIYHLHDSLCHAMHFRVIPKEWSQLKQA